MPPLRAGDRLIALDAPVVMGVLNVTPDSFSDGGRLADTSAAIAAGLRLVQEGAAIVDVGGESTRPGASVVPVEEELARVIPVVRALVREGVCVSLDTRKPEVMRQGLELGVHGINDVTALRSPGALEAVGASRAAVFLMHMQGEPGTMQQAPTYLDVLGEVRDFLRARVDACIDAGIARERLVIDPGFGFGKTLAHNLALLRGLPSLCAVGLPVLAGLSRKSMLQTLTGRTVEDRLAGSLALALVAVSGGARIIRAHDVAATVDALKVWAAVGVRSGA